MKIGRNELCPCGSGKKYKKCCINKNPLEFFNTTVSNTSLGIVNYHNNYLHTVEVKNPTLNAKLLNIYDKYDSLSPKERITDYMEIMSYILDYAQKNKIREIKKIDECNLVSDFLINIIGNFEIEITNIKEKEYNLEVLINYLDKLTSTINLDKGTLENQIRCKVNLLFKLKKVEEGEKLMSDYLNDNPTATYCYVELIDDFYNIGNLDKVKYYYDLALSKKNLPDIEVIEERIDYLK